MIDLEIYDLQVVGKPTRCFAYFAEKSEEFMEWWRSTRWHFANEEKCRKAMKKIDWESTKRKAAEWKEFQEGATVGDSNPKIICSRCSLVLTHPILGCLSTSDVRGSMSRLSPSGLAYFR